MFARGVAQASGVLVHPGADVGALTGAFGGHNVSGGGP